MAKIDDSVKKKVPELRFPGFTDDWEERKLNENVENIGTGRSSFKAGLDYSEQTPYEVLGSTSVISYSDSFDHSGNFVLTARVGANAGNLYKHSGNVKISDNTVYIQSKNLEFIFYLLTKYDLKKLAFGTGQPLIKASELKNLKLFFPKTFGEQKKIGSYFKQLDETIALHQRKLDLLKEQKKGFLQKMFPKNGAKVPELRFAGFADDWEERKLVSMTNYKNGKGHEDKQSTIGKFELINLNSISISGGLKHSGKFIDEADDTLQKDDLVMILSDVGHGDLLGRVALIPEDDRFVLNQRVALLRPNATADPQFLFSYINAHQYYFKAQGAGMSQLNISKGSVENFISFVPIIEEQKKIGTFFKQLDNTITLHQRKLDLLKEQKKGFLQKMFV